MTKNIFLFGLSLLVSVNAVQSMDDKRNHEKEEKIELFKKSIQRMEYLKEDNQAALARIFASRARKDNDSVVSAVLGSNTFVASSDQLARNNRMIIVPVLDVQPVLDVGQPTQNQSLSSTASASQTNNNGSDEFSFIQSRKLQFNAPEHNVTLDEADAAFAKRLEAKKAKVKETLISNMSRPDEWQSLISSYNVWKKHMDPDILNSLLCCPCNKNQETLKGKLVEICLNSGSSQQQQDKKVVVGSSAQVLTTAQQNPNNSTGRNLYTATFLEDSIQNPNAWNFLDRNLDNFEPVLVTYEMHEKLLNIRAPSDKVDLQLRLFRKFEDILLARVSTPQSSGQGNG